MPVIQRKRRADAQPTPSPPARRRRSEVNSEDENGGEPEDDTSANIDEEEENLTAGTHQQMVKKLVRLALASEYSRQPLRRTDISAKVLGPKTSRNTFKTVFADAQKALKETFGMQLSELPLKDRVTIQQKRAAHRTGAAAGASASSATSSNAYILVSTLPASLRTPAILPPARVPDITTEASYTGLSSFIVSLIYLSEGQRISEGKLLRHMHTCNADELVLNGEKTENVLRRLERQGYVVKIKERDGAGGEENIEYIVGPRGKLEIGERGVAGLVRSVYGKRDTELEELEDRLEASLGMGSFKRKTGPQNGAAQDQAAGNGDQAGANEAESSAARDAPTAPGRNTRRTPADYGRNRATRQTRRNAAAAAAAAAESDEEEEEDEEESDED